MANIVDASDYVWLERSHFDDGEANFQRHILQLKTGQSFTQSSSSQPFSISANAPDAIKENAQLHTKIQGLESAISKITERLIVLENTCKQLSSNNSCQKALAPAVKVEKNEEEDDFELFGSDEEAQNEEADRVKQERLKAYEDKKSKKPVLIAKSNIILDVKPWDDETDMAILEQSVRSIEMDGLLWGASKLVPLAYGIRKLQISCVVEDDKVSVDDLEEKIVGFEDYIQSMDIAAFNKI